MDIKKDYIRISQLKEPWRDYEMKIKNINIEKSVMDNKTNIGTNVHEAIYMHTLGLPLPSLTEREQKYFNSYLKWEEANEPVYHSEEQRLYDDSRMLTGQIDGIFSTPGSEARYIIDFKTSSSPSPKHWAVQLGWYWLLCQTNGIEAERKGFMLQLKDTGGPAKMHEYEITDELIGLCYSLYETYIYFNPVSVLEKSKSTS